MEHARVAWALDWVVWEVSKAHAKMGGWYGCGVGEGRGAYLLGGFEVGDGIASVEAAVAGGKVVGENAEVFLAFGI